MSRTVENEKKAKAIDLMREASEYQARGLLIEARGRTVAACKLQASFSPTEANPEGLLAILTAQCGNNLNMMLQQATEQAYNTADNDRFNRALYTLNQAKQLCTAYELDVTPIDQRILQVQQLQGTAPNQQPKVVSVAQARGLDKLEKARAELQAGNIAMVRCFAEEARDPRYGVQKEADQLLEVSWPPTPIGP